MLIANLEEIWRELGHQHQVYSLVDSASWPLVTIATLEEWILTSGDWVSVMTGGEDLILSLR